MTSTDFTWSHYLYIRDIALERIERCIHAVETNKTPVFSMQGQVQFVVAPPDYVSQYTKTMTIPEGGFPMDKGIWGTM